jgi:outer membrane protein assembly factor BamB
MLLVAYDLAGNQKLAFSYHTKVNATDWVSDVILDPGLNAYLTGMAALAPGSPPVRGFMTLKVDARGRLIWGRSLGKGNGYYIGQDSAGTIFVAGYAATSHGIDWATASFSPRGVQRWLRTWNGPGTGNDNPSGLVLSGANMLFVGGSGIGKDAVKGAFVETALIRYDR